MQGKHLRSLLKVVSVFDTCCTDIDVTSGYRIKLIDPTPMIDRLAYLIQKSKDED